MHSKLKGKCNILSTIDSSILAGFFDPDRSTELNNNRKVLYDHYIRHYYMSLLKKLLISRHVSIFCELQRIRELSWLFEKNSFDLKMHLNAKINVVNDFYFKKF